MTKISTILLVLLLFVMTLSAGLPRELTSDGNLELFTELHSKAITNLGKLKRPLRSDYKRLLKSYPDVLMSYLIAYEPDGVLANAAPGTIFSNYHAISELLDRDGLHYSPEFFLAYVAKQGVSDEALTPYRKALLEDGLQDILTQNPSALERYRETALWCVERLRFQPTSGRDQSPLDITQKSLLGRCEEMQILFVAAARTVGIPSRPASTPWWAHMDNNHAWAEVFLDGAWHYTGDMDAAYFPDQTWFSGMIDKTVLILADGNLAPQGEEVLAKGTYDSQINSTINYAKERTRELQLTVLDSLGAPVENALVTPLVYNWGSLRSLTSLSTDMIGRLKLSVGRGAFYIMAYKDGSSALELIDSSPDSIIVKELTLSKAPLKAQTSILEYPSNPMTWQQAPAEYTARVEAAKARIASRFEGFEASVLTRSGASDDSLALEVIKNCRGNQTAFYQFEELNRSVEPFPKELQRKGGPKWTISSPVEQGFLELLRDGDPKFLWTATACQFEALYQFYLAQSSKLEQLSDDNKQFLIDPAVFFEDLPQPVVISKGKAQLYPKSFTRKGKTDVETVRNVIKYMHGRYKIKPSKALSGLLPLQVAYKQKYLNNYQYRILCVSALRANGIPAQFSRIPNVVIVLIHGDWQYYDVVKNRLAELSDPDSGTALSLGLKLQDEAGNPLHINEEQMSISTMDSGTLYPLSQKPEYTGNGNYRANLPQSGLYLQIGYRISDSKTGYLFQPLSTSSDSLYVELILPQYPKSWQAAESYLLDLLKDIDSSAFDVVLLGNHDQENSLRLAEKINAAERNFLWIGYSPSSQTGSNYQVSTAWKAIYEKDQRPRTITLFKNKAGGWDYYEGLWEKLPE